MYVIVKTKKELERVINLMADATGGKLPSVFEVGRRTWRVQSDELGSSWHEQNLPEYY